MLKEALQILAPLAARSYAIALQYLGDLSLDQDDCEAPRWTPSALEERAAALTRPTSAASPGAARPMPCRSSTARRRRWRWPPRRGWPRSSQPVQPHCGAARAWP
jgi:hypothetical protein